MSDAEYGGEADRFTRAIQRFDAENARDPHVEFENNVSWPKEQLYAERLSRWVMRLCPEASESLRLAARCQHLCRWEIPRERYPMDRSGYLRWRQELKQFHARRSAEILRDVGYSEETIRGVQELNLKKNFPSDPESRVLEDALCLVFLEFQFADLASRTEESKMLNALRKSWNKMTPAAHAEALKLSFGSRERQLLDHALEAPSS
jgi:hypothetical protein